MWTFSLFVSVMVNAVLFYGGENPEKEKGSVIQRERKREKTEKKEQKIDTRKGRKGKPDKSLT